MENNIIKNHWEIVLTIVIKKQRAWQSYNIGSISAAIPSALLSTGLHIRNNVGDRWPFACCWVPSVVNLVDCSGTFIRKILRIRNGSTSEMLQTLWGKNLERSQIWILRQFPEGSLASMILKINPSLKFTESGTELDCWSKK